MRNSGTQSVWAFGCVSLCIFTRRTHINYNFAGLFPFIVKFIAIYCAFSFRKRSEMQDCLQIEQEPAWGGSLQVRAGERNENPTMQNFPHPHASISLHKTRTSASLQYGLDTASAWIGIRRDMEEDMGSLGAGQGSQKAVKTGIKKLVKKRKEGNSPPKSGAKSCETMDLGFFSVVSFRQQNERFSTTTIAEN